MSGSCHYRLLVLSVSALLGAGPRASADEAAARAAAGAVVKRLREACQTKAPLGGILLTGARPQGERLELQGYAPGKEQAALLGKEANMLLAGDAAWKKLFPRGASVEGLKTTAALTAELRRACADVKAPAVLRQTRLDAAAYNAGNNTLSLEGECIFLGTAPPRLDRSEPARPAAEAVPIAQALRQALRALPGVAALKANLSVEKVVRPAREKHPLLTLQQHFLDKLRKDDVLLRAWYGADRVLLLEGLVGSKEHLDEIDRFFKNTPLGLRPAGESKQPRWSRVGVRVIVWPLTPARLQWQLARDSSPPQLRQTRLDRVFCAYAEEGGAVGLRFEGVCCSEDAEKDVLGVLRTNLRAEARECWPDLSVYLEPLLVDVKDIKMVPQPRYLGVREKVADNRSLDGVRVDGDAYFDGTGALCLKGLWADRSQKADLETLVRQHLKDHKDGAALVVHGVRLKEGDFKPSYTAAVLASVRAWTASNLEDTWVDRLLFNGRSFLELRGVCGDPDKGAKDRLHKKLLDLLLYVLLTAPDKAARDRLHEVLPDRPGSGPRAVMKLDSLASGLAPALRRRLESAPPALDGVLVERGYFDPSGDYVVSGLLDSDAQREQVQRLLAETAREVGWRSPSGKGQKLGRWTVMEVGPMLKQLGRVMRAYPEFDGIQLAPRAYHDVSKRLVLPCLMVGDRLPGRIQDMLRGLLSDHSRWKQRAAAGVLLKRTELQRVNPSLAEVLVLEAVLDLKKGKYKACGRKVQRALLHAPDDSTAWFLTAACSAARGDLMLARQDLRRLLALEGTDLRSHAAQTRLARLESIQGPERERLGALAVAAEKEMRNYPPPSLADGSD